MAKTPTKRAAKPVPTQEQADEEAVGDASAPTETTEEPAKKAKAKAPKVEAPFPSQADLDAMKTGTYINREVTSD